MEDRKLVWKALSDTTRRSVLDILRDGPATTGAIAAAFAISRIAVMRHLAVLEQSGLVTSQKRGRERWHYLNAPALLGAVRDWLDPLAEQLGGSLLTLKDVAEAAMPDPTIDLAFEVEITATPEALFAAITEHPGAWWSSAFLSPRAVGLTLESTLGGAFVEEWKDGGQLLATVTAVVPGELLALSGSFHLGAGQGLAELQLSPTDGATTVAMSFKAFGPIPPEMVERFPNGWRTLIGDLLKEHAETGRVVGIAAQTGEKP